MKIHSDQIEMVAAALAKAQGQMATARRSAVNPHFRSQYATLADLVETLREPLADNGLCILHTPLIEDGMLMLETHLIHESGQYIGCRLPIIVDDKRNSPQAVGSAITYMKRYALGCITGIVDAAEDDDGEMAEGRRAIHASFVGPATKPEPRKINEKQQKLIFVRANQVPGLMDSIKNKFGEIENIPADEMDKVLRNIEIAKKKFEEAKQPVEA